MYLFFNVNKILPLVKPIVDDLINEGVRIVITFNAKPVS